MVEKTPMMVESFDRTYCLNCDEIYSLVIVYSPDDFLTEGNILRVLYRISMKRYQVPSVFDVRCFIV